MVTSMNLSIIFLMKQDWVKFPNAVNPLLDRIINWYLRGKEWIIFAVSSVFFTSREQISKHQDQWSHSDSQQKNHLFFRVNID